METVNQRKDILAGRSGRADVLGDPARWSLYLDIDGTLLGIAPTPDAVQVPAHLVGVLERVAAGLGGAMALLTGRRIADADRLLAPLKLIAAGVHGTELRARHGGEVQALAPAIDPEFVARLNRIGDLVPGVLVEQKGAGMAVHYRNAPDAGRVIMAELVRIAGDPRYQVELRGGRMVIEVVPRTFSKASALTWLAERPPFAGRLPVMIGDDVGDESALALAERMGGLGLRVAGEHFPRAVSDFDGVADVHDWLVDLALRLDQDADARG